MTGPKRGPSNVLMSISLSVSRSSLPEIEAGKIAMQLQRPTEPSLEHLHPLRQQLLAGEARISRATHFNGESAPEETSAHTSMSRPNKHAEKLPLGPHPRGGKGSGKGGKGKEKKDTSKIPCLFYPKGTCKNGKNCPFMHRDASPSVPAKGDGDKGGKPRSPSPKRRRSKKRGKSADKKATCCLSSTATLTGEPSACSNIRFALAARKGEAYQRDHWVVDEHKGTCTRVHQKFRSCLYAPQRRGADVPLGRFPRLCGENVQLQDS